MPHSFNGLPKAEQCTFGSGAKCSGNSSSRWKIGRVEGWVECLQILIRALMAVLDLEGCGLETISQHRSAVVLLRFGMSYRGVACDGMCLA